VLSLAFATQNIAAKIESILTDNRIIRRSTTAVAVLFFVVALSSMLYLKDHDAKRRPFYHDFYLQNIELPQRLTISVCPADIILNDWLFADMQRFYRISLTPDMGHPYLVIAKNSSCTVPGGYQRVNQEPTIKYHLYKKNRP
jgi:hypothetical protein